KVGAPVPDPVPAPRAGHLARDDQLVAWAPREPVAEESFCPSLRRRVGRHGIHLRRIDEVDALCDGVIELRVRLLFAVLLAPGHGAEADFGDVELRAGEGAVFHWRLEPSDSSSHGQKIQTSWECALAENPETHYRPQPTGMPTQDLD